MDVTAILASLDARGLLRITGELLLVLVVVLLALRFAGLLVSSVLGRLFDREAREGTAQELSALEIRKRRATLQDLVGGVLKVVILVVGTLMALRALGLDIGPAIAGLGVAGLALSLGAQHLVRDYVAGAFILIENQYAKGDIVRIADVTGTVEDVSLRRTSIRDLDGTLHSVPHGLVGVASNLTRIWARINVDIVVPYGPDASAAPDVLARASELVDAAGRELADDPAWKRRVLEAPRVSRIEALGPTGVTLKILGTVGAADRWSASTELRRRIVVAFAREGIPFA